MQGIIQLHAEEDDDPGDVNPDEKDRDKGERPVEQIHLWNELHVDVQAQAYEPPEGSGADP